VNVVPARVTPHELLLLVLLALAGQPARVAPPAIGSPIPLI